jgi:hypothetical protein
MFSPKRQTVQPRHAFTVTHIRLAGVGTCQFLNHNVGPQVFTFLWNRYHEWLADIELMQISAFLALYSKINPCFTARKQSGVDETWQSTRGHLISTIVASIYIVYVYNGTNVALNSLTHFFCLQICPCNLYNSLWSRPAAYFLGLF